MRNFATATIILLLALSSCSGLKVTQHYDEEIDFSQHKTFFIMPPDPFIDLHMSKSDQELILRCIADEMRARGYRRHEATGDLVVNMSLIMNKKTGSSNYNQYYNRSGYRFVNTWGYGSSNGYQQHTIKKGTLIIDVFDNRLKRLAWQGIGYGSIKEDPVKRAKNIPHIIRKMFYEYPQKNLR